MITRPRSRAEPTARTVARVRIAGITSTFSPRTSSASSVARSGVPSRATDTGRALERASATASAATHRVLPEPPAPTIAIAPPASGSARSRGQRGDDLLAHGVGQIGVVLGDLQREADQLVGARAAQARVRAAAAGGASAADGPRGRRRWGSPRPPAASTTAAGTSGPRPGRESLCDRSAIGNSHHVRSRPVIGIGISTGSATSGRATNGPAGSGCGLAPRPAPDRAANVTVDARNRRRAPAPRRRSRPTAALPAPGPGPRTRPRRRDRPPRRAHRRRRRCDSRGAAWASISTQRWAKKPPMPPVRPSRSRRMIASAPSSARICGISSCDGAAAVGADVVGADRRRSPSSASRGSAS